MFGVLGPDARFSPVFDYGTSLTLTDESGNRFARSAWAPATRIIALSLVLTGISESRWGYVDLEQEGISSGRELFYQVEMGADLQPWLNLCARPEPLHLLEGPMAELRSRLSAAVTVAPAQSPPHGTHDWMIFPAPWNKYRTTSTTTPTSTERRRPTRPPAPPVAIPFPHSAFDVMYAKPGRSDVVARVKCRSPRAVTTCLRAHYLVLDASGRLHLSSGFPAYVEAADQDALWRTAGSVLRIPMRHGSELRDWSRDPYSGHH
ncbi:hypothetical protein STRCI_008454 [Streptomyces cinnabarinus]|uniref:Uncharacterized protein n=1 Tax=Streptomyces cinnabarinus TaxID=67287 RepID=A0ABY7KVB1_9ACTN|nr:hypothetical protein [Streptomyces cinnabarinus]WAZ26809.1 hypothetical protein STRCI_008454 [Streptomyces cinnabarinus]